VAAAEKRLGDDCELGLPHSVTHFQKCNELLQTHRNHALTALFDLSVNHWCVIRYSPYSQMVLRVL
jgi:hypothetical protein